MVPKAGEPGGPPSDGGATDADADAAALFPAVLDLVMGSLDDCQPQLRLVCHAARDAVDRGVDTVRARALPADPAIAGWAALPRVKNFELSLMPGLADELSGSLELQSFLDADMARRLVDLPLPRLASLALAPLAVEGLPALADGAWPKLEELAVHAAVAITDEGAFEGGFDAATLLAGVGASASDAFGRLERAEWPLKRLAFTMFPLAPGMDVPVAGLAAAAASFRTLAALHLSAALTAADVELLTGADFPELRDLKIDFGSGEGGRGCLEAVAAAVAAGRWGRLTHLELEGIALLPPGDAEAPMEALACLKTLRLGCSAGSEDGWARLLRGLDGGALRILVVNYKGTFNCLNGLAGLHLPALIILTAACYDDGAQGGAADAPLAALFSAQLPALKTATLRYRDVVGRSRLAWEPPAPPAAPLLPAAVFLELEGVDAEAALAFLGRALPRKCILHDCATRSEPMWSWCGEEPTPEDLVWDDDDGSALEGNSEDEDIAFVAFKGVGPL